MVLQPIELRDKHLGMSSTIPLDGAGRAPGSWGDTLGVPPAPGALPDEQGGLGPDPGAHGDAGAEHGEEVDLLHQQAGPVLDLTVGDGLVGLRGDGHVGLTPAGTHGDSGPKEQGQPTASTALQGGDVVALLVGHGVVSPSPLSLSHSQDVFPEAALPLGLVEEVIEVAAKGDEHKAEGQEAKNAWKRTGTNSSQTPVAPRQRHRTGAVLPPPPQLCPHQEGAV